MFKRISYFLVGALICFTFGCETIAVFRSGEMNLDDVNRMIKLEHGSGAEEKPIGSLGLLRKSDVWMRTNLW